MEQTVLKDKWLFFRNIYVCNDGILFARSFKLVNFVNKPLHKNKDGADAYN